MALINCSECSNQVSDKAVACPHCGCPVKLNTISNTSQNDNQVVNISQNNNQVATTNQYTLIQCKSCGNNISNMATNCPHCGCPVIAETFKVMFIRKRKRRLGGVNIKLFYDDEKYIDTLRNDDYVEFDMPKGNHRIITELVSNGGAYFHIPLTGVMIGSGTEIERYTFNINVEKDNQIYLLTPNWSAGRFEMESVDEVESSFFDNSTFYNVWSLICGIALCLMGLFMIAYYAPIIGIIFVIIGIVIFSKAINRINK